MTNDEMLKATSGRDTDDLSPQSCLSLVWERYDLLTPEPEVPVLVSNNDGKVYAAVYIRDEMGWQWNIQALVTNGDLNDVGNYEYMRNLEFKYWCYIDTSMAMKGNELKDEYDWMEEARGIAAQCWCDEDTKHKEMDVVLAEAMARRLALWMQTAAQNQRNTDYYRRLLEHCGEIIGERAFLAADGTKMDDVLCSKIPDILFKDYSQHEQ